MLVLNTTSPAVSPRAPKPRPVYTVPSSRASFAVAAAIALPRPLQGLVAAHLSLIIRSATKKQAAAAQRGAAVEHVLGPRALLGLQLVMERPHVAHLERVDVLGEEVDHRPLVPRRRNVLVHLHRLVAVLDEREVVLAVVGEVDV